MLANEKQFDKNLTKIGELYEEGKDCLNFLDSEIERYPDSASEERYNRLFKILSEMRDIACVNLKINHKVEEN